MVIKKVLVVAAHPDDEVLGCGGTIARLSEEGATVHVAFLADGTSSRQSVMDSEAARKDRQLMAERACAVLGVNSLSFADFPDNELDSVSLLSLAREIEGLVQRFEPDTIFTHHSGDLNIDHVRVNNAVAVACRPQQEQSVRRILCFEVPSSTEWSMSERSGFTPNWFVDISANLAHKLTALREYSVELRGALHPRSLEGVEYLARWRGVTIGTQAAEAFVLGRCLI